MQSGFLCETQLQEYVSITGCDRGIVELTARLAEEMAGGERKEATYLLEYLRAMRNFASGGLVADFRGGRVADLRFQYRTHGSIGRLYALCRTGGTVEGRAASDTRRGLCLQGAPGVLRPLFCGAFAHDIDIVNCQPTIAVQMCDQFAITPPVGLPMLDDYIANRDAWVQRVADYHALTDDASIRKDVVKSLMVRLLFGGTYEGWLRKLSLDRGKREPSVQRVAQELASLRRAVFASAEWAPFCDAAFRRARAQGKDDRAAERSVFAFILQSIEAWILASTLRTVAASGLKVLAAMYDGFVLLHVDDFDVDRFMRQAEADVLHSTGFRISLSEKPLFGLHTQRLCLKREGK